MKPCDCKSISDMKKLEVNGITKNGSYISIDPTGVFLKIDKNIEIKISHENFKHFAEWYFENQKKYCDCGKLSSPGYSMCEKCSINDCLNGRG